MENNRVKSLVFLFICFISIKNINAQCSISSNIVTNSNFQSGNTGFSSSYVYSAGNLVTEGKYDVNTNPRNDHANFSICGDHTSGSGNMMVINAATVAGVSVWCQTVAVNINTTYTFSTWIASVHTSNPAILQFSINGVNLGSPFTASSTTCNWQQFCETWDSNGNTSATICIVNQNTAAGGNDFALDDIQMGPTVVLDNEIFNISATNYEEGTVLNWETKNDNIKFCTVEKSFDLLNWTDISTLNSDINGITKHEYFDKHKSNNKTLYYRIKSTDFDGKTHYSIVKSIISQKDEIKICPNPTYDKIYIFGIGQVVSISVLNSLEIEEKKINFYEHEYPLELNLSDFKAGIYFLKIISNDNTIEILRLVKR
jgi:hypothetical protein